MVVALAIITVVSVTVAVAMTVVAWRLYQEEERRSEARVQALATVIGEGEATAEPSHAPDVEIHRLPPVDRAAARVVEVAPAVDPPPPAPPAVEPAPVALSSDLFSASEPEPSRGRLAATAAAVVLVAAGALVAVMITSGAHRSARPAAAQTQIAPAAAAPLELIALGHERDGDRLTVRGVVRNPGAAEVDNLVAVVFAFDRDGGFVTSARAPIATPALASGGDSTFVVAVPGLADVARYRVSFRTDDHVIPHVDRRDRQARAEAAPLT